MTWWKNGLLLAAGGVAGLALAAWLESEGKSDDYDEDYEERPRRNVPKADGMELLVIGQIDVYKDRGEYEIVVNNSLFLNYKY